MAALVSVFVTCIVLTSTPSSTLAQTKFGQPVYPAYQGFLNNPDGSVTMVFQYFSHGRDPVTIPAGPANGFTGVADRNQPTTFYPGNHEFVCVMVVENREVAAATRWTIAFPELASQTSLDPLNNEYQLMESTQKEAERALDVATAPRGICVNKPPRASTNRLRRPTGDPNVDDKIEEVGVALGAKLRLQGSAQDEGLPRGSTVTAGWRKVSGPGEVVFASPSQAVTTAEFSAAGTYELELHASDGELEHADRIRVKVGG